MFQEPSLWYISGFPAFSPPFFQGLSIAAQIASIRGYDYLYDGLNSCCNSIAASVRSGDIRGKVYELGEKAEEKAQKLKAQSYFSLPQILLFGAHL